VSYEYYKEATERPKEETVCDQKYRGSIQSILAKSGDEPSSIGSNL
jgi:hypothetical protein